MKNLLFLLGTRPEAIKLAPLILEFKKYPNLYNVIVCNTEQQKELSSQALSFFGIKADLLLDTMTQDQSLNELQARILIKLDLFLSQNKIDATIVQGDTMSAFAGALASFFCKIPIFYVEAGLRSYDLNEPFPEESIRQMVSRIANLYFAPTKDAERALIKENLNLNKIYLTGNTSIDALKLLSANMDVSFRDFWLKMGVNIEKNEIVLVTIHRRENHGSRLQNILQAIKKLSYDFPTHNFIVPVHPNPNIRKKVYEYLSECNNIFLIEPIEYPHLIYILKNAKLILTDSGGIQEEAPTFGCPILVLRYETERKEGVELGFSQLIGAETDVICKKASDILLLEKEETRIYKENPYGSGDASQKIEKIVREFLYGQN
ncbi:non-hydrolyzing UDP-N-acetylglucosamine 2-epimerase [Helicobacter pullorum]|uniref:UDP-N-acetylglucosamine 2-epimerase (non-hydrolyzing) n=1 Tax=Helicobacter pullorum TaxID=35818 RepID=A0A377PY24_9HELI|nr:UDP-N-acetylglucosamine 2-epimerase (non-hydrolyzing) [Helicobacter pullorum]STQ87400.1 UDP-N-acetylglucosamine 2-epimerase [Helicobacter pullorum]